MAEKCTKTSSPVERWMKPYPFAPLNHLTVPFSLTEKLLSLIIKNKFPDLSFRCSSARSAPSRNAVEPGCVSLCRRNCPKAKDSSVRCRMNRMRRELLEPWTGGDFYCPTQDVNLPY